MRSSLRSTSSPSSARPRRRLAAALAVLTALAGLALVTAVPSPAAVATMADLPTLPTILDGRVESFAVVGDRAFVGGTFTQLRLADGTTVSQPYLFAYSLATGAFDTAFRPAIAGGQVLVVEPVVGGAGVYVGGAFDSVNGTMRRRIARVNLDGSLYSGFDAQPNSRVKDIAAVGSRLFIGGTFTSVAGTARSYLAEISPTTGALVPTFTIGITGNAARGGFVSVQSLRPSPDGTKLAVVHTGTAVGGVSRVGLAVINLAAGSATLNPYNTNHWSDNIIRVGGFVQANKVAWDPTSSWVVVSSNGGDRPPTNDTIARFTIAGATTAPQAATWVTRMFDSAFSVAVAPDGTVYGGGHFNYTEAPGSMEPWPGEDLVNYGFGPAGGARVLGSQVVGRSQLAALDPATGKARNWHYTAEGRFGVTALKVTSDRLLVGHDGNRTAGTSYGPHGAVPLFGAQRGTGPLSTVTSPLMGAVLQVGPLTISGTATAPAGVERVSVEVKRGAQWLQPNGTWGGYYQLPATMGAAAGGSRSWTLPVTLPEGGAYTITSKAWDTAGNSEQNRITVPIETIDGSNPPPTLLISSPTAGQSNFASNTITVSGTATDTDGIAAVQLTFYNEAQFGYLQKDGTVADDFDSFNASLGTPTGATTPWSYSLKLPNGPWSMLATPVDRKGVAPARGYAVSFTMAPGDTAPTVVISSPAAGSRITDSVTITGTASDNVGVKKVYVKIGDQRFALGPQPSGGYGPNYSWFASVLGSPGAKTTTWTIRFGHLPTGAFTAFAYAEDTNGLTTPAAGQPRLVNLQQRPVGSPTVEPSTTLLPDGTTLRPTTLSVALSGAAGYSVGVSAVRLAIRDQVAGLWLQADNSLGTAIAYRTVAVTPAGGTSTTWKSTLTFPRASRYTVDALAVGKDANLDWTYPGSRQTYYVYPGDADPTLEWNTPATGATVRSQIAVSGRAFDDKGVSAVQVMLTNSATTGLRADGTVGTAPVWLPAYISNPGGLFTNVSYSSPVLPTGTWTVAVRAVDSVGKPMVTYPKRTVTVS